VKNWFQNLPFKCNLQRYTAADVLTWRGNFAKLLATPWWGSARWNQVDP
jgi:hypothetical protein